jgi:DNA mismatch endonuclease (patch repair protein)
MADVFTKEQRSDVMQKVKSNRNKSTELKLIAFFKVNGIKGWRRNFKIFGKPDFTFPKQKTVVFVDGCFWHGHDCRNTRPKDNADYWAKNSCFYTIFAATKYSAICLSSLRQLP